jgi:hypothetical protein
MLSQAIHKTAAAVAAEVREADAVEKIKNNRTRI